MRCHREVGDTELVEPVEPNVLGGPLQPCGDDPITGYFRDGSCACREFDVHHTVCAVMTQEFLDQQRRSGNDLITAMPSRQFPGLRPGDRWCVVAARWMHAFLAGAPAPVVLASTNRKALEVIPLEVLKRYAVDVPEDASSLTAGDH